MRTAKYSVSPFCPRSKVYAVGELCFKLSLLKRQKVKNPSQEANETKFVTIKGISMPKFITYTSNLYHRFQELFRNYTRMAIETFDYGYKSLFPENLTVDKQ